ncbi:unnamed protein product, partial [Adineta steineri]
MDVILILAITLLFIFLGALFWAKKRQSGQNDEREPAPVQRRLGPVDDARPRAAQIRRRRFDPAHRYDAGAQNDNNDDPEEFDPTTMDDTVEIDSKMGTKKRLKLEAKAEKRQQREQELVERKERKERDDKFAEERRQKELEEEQREKEQ